MFKQTLLEDHAVSQPQLEHFLQRLQESSSNDDEIRRQIFDVCNDRLLRMTRKMLGQFPQVRRWEQTDDVWQQASLRLWRALETVSVHDARHFLNLAALQIRRQLIELARHYGGPQGFARHHQTPTKRTNDSSLGDRHLGDETHEASRLAIWTELHQRVSLLPDDEREVFDLIWYQGLPQAEVAQLLDVSIRTIKRRWQAARLRLHDVLERDGAIG